MTENKRFQLKSWNYNHLNGTIYDNLKKEELCLSLYEIVDLLNEVSQSEYNLIQLKEDIIKKLNSVCDNVDDEYSYCLGDVK